MKVFRSLEKLVEMGEKRTARALGIPLKAYRVKRDKLIETLGLNNEEIQSKGRVRTRNKNIPQQVRGNKIRARRLER